MMSKQQDRPPEQPTGQSDNSRALVIIEERKRDIVKMLDDPAKSGLILSLLGNDEEIFRRFRAVALHTIARNNNLLLECTPASIMDALREAAEVKLEVAGILGEGYLIPYRGQATFQAGYRGLMKLARRSGQVDAIDSHVVFEKDRFEVHLGTNPEIVHVPPSFGDRGKYIGAYAWARLRTGELIVEPMSTADIEKVRMASRNPRGKDSPWTNWWEEMARKTVLKRLMKRLPLGEDAEALLRYEARIDEEHAQPVEPASRAEQMRAGVLSLLPGSTEVSGNPQTDGAAPGAAGGPDGSSGVTETGENSPRAGYCGADNSDETEWCTREPGHKFPNGTMSPHSGPSGSTWPNASNTA